VGIRLCSLAAGVVGPRTESRSEDGGHEGADDIDEASHIRDGQCEEAGRSEDDSGPGNPLSVAQARL